jgi:hypothetical protein
MAVVRIPLQTLWEVIHAADNAAVQDLIATQVPQIPHATPAPPKEPGAPHSTYDAIAKPFAPQGVRPEDDEHV